MEKKKKILFFSFKMSLQDKIDKFYGKEANSTYNLRDIHNKAEFLSNYRPSSKNILSREINFARSKYTHLRKTNYNIQLYRGIEKANDEKDLEIFNRLLLETADKEDPCFAGPANIMRKCISLGDNCKSILRGFLSEKDGITYFGYSGDGDLIPINFTKTSVRQAIISGFTNSISSRTEIFPYAYASFMAPETIVIEEYDDLLVEDVFTEASEEKDRKNIKAEYIIQMQKNKHRRLTEDAEEEIISNIVYLLNGKRDKEFVRETLDEMDYSDDLSLGDRMELEFEDEELTEEYGKNTTKLYFPKSNVEVPHSIVEYVSDYILLSEFVKTCNADEFYKILYILMDGLQIANNDFGYINYSLLANNIMIIDNKELVTHKCGIKSRYTPKIIDLSKSRASKNSIPINLYYHEVNAIFNSYYENYPISDVYTLLISTYLTSNSNIKNVISKVWRESTNKITGNLVIDDIEELLVSKANIYNLPYLGGNLTQYKYKYIVEFLNKISVEDIRRNDTCHKWTIGQLVDTLNPKITIKNKSNLKEHIDLYFTNSLLKLSTISDNELFYLSSDHHQEILKGLHIDLEYNMNILKDYNSRNLPKDDTYENILNKILYLEGEISKFTKNGSNDDDNLFYKPEDITMMNVVSIENIKDILNISNHFVTVLDYNLSLMDIKNLGYIYNACYNILEYIKESINYEYYTLVNRYAMSDYLEGIIAQSLVKRQAFLKLYTKYAHADLLDNNFISNDVFEREEINWNKTIQLDSADIKEINISPYSLSLRSGEGLFTRKVINPVKDASIYVFNSLTGRLMLTRSSLVQMRDGLNNWIDSKPYYNTLYSGARKIANLF